MSNEELVVSSAPKRRTPLIVGAVVALVAVVAGAGVLMTGSDDATVITLVSSSTKGTDPFTKSVQVGAVPAISPVADEAATATRDALPTDSGTAVLVATGTAPGLYGGTGDAKSCDPNALVDYLATHGDKAAAWSRVLGIKPDGIATYVAGLTPVVLTADTLVTNHGYHDGVATKVASVLQAGTAVMVDAEGVPRVKCNCGNPLTPPQLVSIEDAGTTGDAWGGYSDGEVLSVVAGTTATDLTLLDITSGSTYATPVGSTIDGARKPAPDGVAGDWTISLRQGGALMEMYTPTAAELQTCVGARLGGLVMKIKGGTATVRGIDDVGTMSGPVDGGPVDNPVVMDGGTVIRLRTSDGTGPEVTLSVLYSADHLSGGTNESGSRVAGELSFGTCTFHVVAIRVGSVDKLPPSAPTTTALTTTTPAPLPTIAVGGLPAGMFCRDLAAQGFGFADAVSYWRLHGQPVNMDADGNGVPCETVYSAAEVAAVWGAVPTPTTAATAGTGPCTLAALRTVVTESNVDIYSVGVCDGRWAAPGVSVTESGDSFDISVLLEWNGSKWVKGDCEKYRDPAHFELPRAGTVPAFLFGGACASN